MKKSDSKPEKENLEQELKRLRKENAKLRSQKEADKAKIEDLKKKVKKTSRLKARSQDDKAEIKDLKKELKKKSSRE